MAATATSLTRSPFANSLSNHRIIIINQSSSSSLLMSRRPHRLKVLCSSPSIHKTLTDIHSSGVIACLRANSAELAFEAACAALEGGISVLEIVMSTPGVFEVLQQLVHMYPTRVLGVGTVLNIEDAERAVTVGAKFLVSPAIVMDIMENFRCWNVVYIPGVMTPTEILSAYNAGAKLVKIYPVSALGGTHYISAIKKPFPHISMVASQGITIGSAGEYIAKGASSVVLSDAIFDKEAMDQKNFNIIHQLANMAALQCKEAVDRLEVISFHSDCFCLFLPIVEDPDRAFMSDSMRKTVKRLARCFPTAIVTGRCIDKVYNFVRLPELYYAGSHGMDIRDPAKGSKSGQGLLCEPATKFLPMIDEVYKLLVEKTKSIRGAKVEDNKFCLSVHFRCVDEKKWSELALQVESVLKEYPQLRLSQGRKVLEIRPTIKWDKGMALEFLLESLGYANCDDVFPVYIGDDRTDEDAFKVLSKRGQGSGILVSKIQKETCATYSLQEPSEVMDFLQRMVELYMLEVEEVNLGSDLDNVIFWSC